MALFETEKLMKNKITPSNIKDFGEIKGCKIDFDT